MRWTVKGWAAKEQPANSKPAAPAGKLSKEQVEKLDHLIEVREHASDAYLAAQQAYTDFLEEITAR
jgi:hypothetical protein